MKKGKKVSKLAFHEALRGYLFIAPALILLLGLLFLPMVKGFGYSLTDFNILKNWDYNFIGLENFQKILKNRDFPVILKNEVFFALTVTVITVIVSILIALLLNSVKRCKNIVRALVFMPWVLPEVVDVGSKDGKLWTIPSWVDLSPYMMYNVEALKAIGLTEETVPKTWSEFKDAAVKFKEAGYIGYSIPMSMDNYSDMNNEFNYWNWQLGGAPMNDDATVMTMNDEHAIATVEFLKSMYDAGTFSDGAETETYMDRHEEFFGGISATNIGYTYINGIITDMEVSDDLDYIMADMPRPDEGTAIDEDKAFYRMISSNQEISVSSISENIDACGEFLQYLIDEDYWHKWVTEVGARTPADKASYEDDALRAETQAVQPDLVKMYDEGTLMTGVKPKPSYGGVTEIQTTMSQYLVDIITGRYDSVEEGLNELNTECQALLDEYSEE